MSEAKILYIEAGDGISGDMTLGALIDLGVDVAEIKNELNKFVKDSYDIIANPFERNGIKGTNLEVVVDFEEYEYDHSYDYRHPHEHEHEPSHNVGFEEFVDDHSHDFRTPHESEPKTEHSHNKYSDIVKMIEDSDIAEGAKKYALDIFSVIADAEAHVHGMSKEEIAFHEVGAMDSIIDIVGTAIAIDMLGVDEVYCGKLHDGSGTVLCRHGLIPVPVPAVMAMMKDSDLPIVIDEDVNTEMITPTGFGILKGLCAKFEPHFGFYAHKIGYGFGKRDTGRLGAVRITLGTKYNEED